MTLTREKQKEIDLIFNFLKNEKGVKSESSSPMVEVVESVEMTLPIETDILLETDERIWERVNRIFDFLRITHPFIPEKDGVNVAFEIRFFINKKEKSTVNRKSFNAVDFSEERKQELFEMLKGFNGKPVCMYYSLAGYDLFKEVKNTKTGNMYKPFKIHNSTFVKCQVLAMDFDELSYEEYLVQKQRINDLGIEMIELRSGKGFQCLILLNEAYQDATTLKRFTELLIEKGFDVDSKIKDSARIMRPEGTKNTKAYCLQNAKRYDVQNPQPIEVVYLNKTNKRYDLSFVFERLESLESVVKIEKGITEVKVSKAPKMIKTVKKDVVLKEATNNEKNITLFGNIDSYYSYIKPSTLPKTIEKILHGVHSGIRNDAIMFILPCLKNKVGLSLEATIETALEWNRLCSPSEDEKAIIETIKWSYREAKGTFGAYTKELEKVYGVKELFAVTFDKTIKVNNAIFENFADIQNAAVRIYFSVVLLNHNHKEKKQTNFTAEEINKYANISEVTFKRTIKVLTNKTRLLGRKRQNKKEGEAYTYYLNKAIEREESGFTIFSPNDLKLLFKEHKLGEINDTQMALYLFLHSMSYVEGKEIWATQKHFAEKIGKSQNRVSELMKELEKLEKIKIIRIRHGAKMKNNYLLQ